MSTLYDIPTPAVVIDQPRVARNIARMQAIADGRALRPHAKTHKSAAMARRQIAAGAVGICCAKLGEAEVFADAGIADIRVPYPVHPSNAARVVALLDRTALSIVVDHPRIAREWSEAMSRAGRTLPVLVKVDVGLHRCGVDPHSTAALDLVVQVSRLPGLSFRGLLSHGGHAYLAASEDDLAAVAADEAATLGALAGQARASGVAVHEISVGATPSARFSALQPGITELRPGNYIYFDRTQVGLGSCTLDDCALTVVSTVVSKPASDRIILDAGSKTLSSDGARGFAPLAGHGAVFTGLDTTLVDETLLVERLSEEHATVRVTNGSTALEPGDRVRILPNHSCVVSNLVDEITIVDGERVVDTMRVDARGRIR
jgi:D-serine deaminase-like pyridoxal phosphate-dependent protein